MTTLHTLRTSLILVATAGLLAATTSLAQTTTMPDPTSTDFCVVVQKILANTELTATNEIFNDMPEYRHSKPSPNPLMIYQIVTYDEVGPIVVSCKVKAADHIRSEYGADAAGEQLACPTITRLVHAQAIAELQQENPEAAAAAAGFVIDETEVSMTGQAYLSDFQSIYTGEDGAIHIASPGLQADWESMMGWIMPDRFMGQTYCHLATVDYMKRIAAGTAEPGATITTEDDAPTTPPGS